MLPKAIIFDAFGTLIDVKRRTHPYRMIMREGARQGRIPSRPDLRTLMTCDCSVAQAASLLGIRITPSILEVVQAALDEELDSAEPYSDALEAIEMLSSAGILLGVCSNLASPYGPRVRELLPQVDAFALSYEIGVMKPDPAIYQAMCASLEVQPDRDWMRGGASVLMIGNSPKCDRDGPRVIGISGMLLDRTGSSKIGDLFQFAGLVLAGSL